MKRRRLAAVLSVMTWISVTAQTEPVDYVNPFIGSSNYGATNPGALCPQGLISVSPFNVTGSDGNTYDKDKRWWSTPYVHENSYFTGFSHVNLSGVGCPDAGSLLLMPTSGALEVDYRKYGSGYTQETASPGYYSNYLTKYGIKTEVSATPRAGIARFTFPQGKNNILLNLGEGLTNETGAMLRKVNDTEIEGMKLLGTFCYTQNQAVFPVYFVMRVSKTPERTGYWKFQRPVEKWEEAWNADAGKYKLYTRYEKEIAGDDIGAYFTFDCTDGETVEVQLGVSFVSIENARLNLQKEQPAPDFEAVRTAARRMWNDDLSRIRVEGGTYDQRVVFYTGLYHILIHPNILQDVNGDYPAMESSRIKNTAENRYTVYSLWDTYRSLHQMMTLVFPDRQMQMVRTMVDMYRECGWMPKWELYGRESLTMEGDPAIPVIVDTWMKGLRDFDAETAYEACYKSAVTPGTENVLRPDNDDYMRLGYVPLRAAFDNSVSHALEYYIADWNLAQFAKALGKDADAEMFHRRSLGYKHYYSKACGTLRPVLPNGDFLTPFNPLSGANFEPNPGFHEGSAWNYTFAVPHDIPGLIRLMGGKKAFTAALQQVFDRGYFDVTNEPDMNYPHYFSHIEGEEWRTQKIVREILDRHFTNTPGGIPGNEDTGTMSAWAVFNMMGFYPECPGRPDYTATTPVFDKITLTPDARYYKSEPIVIRTVKPGDTPAPYIKEIRIDGKKLPGYRITHEQLVRANEITYILKPPAREATPTPSQVAWQQLEYYMFVHFGPNTFTDVEWGDGQEDPQVFNPSAVDCRQWAATAKAAGMQGIIITAKHHDGFCLWPSRYSTHTVRESPWKDGKGDLLRELSDACREYGLKFGIYLSPWDRNHPSYGTPEYNKTFAGMLDEVLSGYGDIFEQWFDGANGEGHEGKKQVYDWEMFHEVVFRNQPQAIIFSDIGPGCRWMGNEQGVAGETNWSTLNVTGYSPGRDAPPVQVLNTGVQGGEAWVPAETDVSIRPGWFYSPATDDKVKSVDQLMDIYYTSVGRNSNLLLNVPPDRRGRIPPNDSVRLMEFRRAREAAFNDNLTNGATVKASHTRGNSPEYTAANLLNDTYDSYWTTDDNVHTPALEIDLKKEKTFNCLLLQEYIPLGQHVSAFSVKYWDQKSRDWKKLAEATTIGYKRILRFPSVTAQKLKIEFNAPACPAISAVRIYRSPETAAIAGKTKKSGTVAVSDNIDPAKWTVISPPTNDAARVIDGDIRTSAELPITEALTVDLGKSHRLKGFTCHPVEEVQAAHIHRYDFYVSVDGKDWIQVKNKAMFNNIANNPVRQAVLFDKPVNARYIRIKPLESVGNKDRYIIAEIGIMTR